MGTIFPGPRLVAAVVDRVTFNAHILETGIQSYRLRTSEAATRGRKPSWTTAQAGARIHADQWGKSLDDTHMLAR